VSDYNNDLMLDMFVFETTQLLEQLEQVIIETEKASCYEQDAINEIFRIMHTIKGSSAMMRFNFISSLAHSIEDLFHFLREGKPLNVDYLKLSDIVFESVDFIKEEIRKIENRKSPDRDASVLIEKIRDFLAVLKESNPMENVNETKATAVINEGDQKSKVGKRSFKAVVYFEEGCEMEDIRALALINDLLKIAGDVQYYPTDIADDNKSAEIIRKEGFQIWFKTDRTFEEMHDFFSKTIFLKDLELTELKGLDLVESKNDEPVESKNNEKSIDTVSEEEKIPDKEIQFTPLQQSIISVNVSKLDKLMDLVGELVISEAMVTQNPEIAGLTLDNFHKAARQHRKIISELQDVAMSIRMIPLSATLQRMNRIVRDMSRKLSKEVRLEIIGEETEVDKNIIERISDPLMHLVRNSIDHGIEPAEERKNMGKPEIGTVTIEAKNAGGDVLIIVKDDGRGLNRESILKKARANGLINRPETDLTDREIYSYIFLPGFSTNEKITEFSGRGVGMDVVARNIASIGGTVSVDSAPGEGTTITLKIPLTLAIMGGMIVRVGKSTYTIPVLSIKESFKANEDNVITDIEGNEMIMIRGECYPILRLHKIYNVKTETTNIHDGIVVMVENDGKGLCIFADELIGEQQVVVKALPNYIKNLKKVRGVAGCTLLGDGSISLILDIADLVEN